MTDSEFVKRIEAEIAREKELFEELVRTAQQYAEAGLPVTDEMQETLDRLASAKSRPSEVVLPAFALRI